MTSRVHEVTTLAPEEPGLAAPSAEVATTLAAAVSAPVGVLAASVTALVEALQKVRPGPDAEANGRAVLGVLDEPRLVQAVDGSGREVRVEAVGALLRLGYPWALQMDPAHLEHYRAATARKGRSRWWPWVLLAALLAAGGGFAIWLSTASLLTVPTVRSAPFATIELSVARVELGAPGFEGGLTMNVAASGKAATLPFTSVDTVKLVDATTGQVLRTWSKAELKDVGTVDMPGGRGHLYRLSAPIERGLLGEVCLVATGDLVGLSPASVRSPVFSVETLPVAKW